jgi:hypothetical protein
MSEWFIVSVICTGRGKHKRRTLGQLSPFTTGPCTFRCLTCRPPRNVPWRAETVRRIYDTLAASGMHTVDISYQ